MSIRLRLPRFSDKISLHFYESKYTNLCDIFTNHKPKYGLCREREMNFLSIYKKTTTTKFLHYSLQELVKLTSEDFNTSLDQPHRPCYRSVFSVRLGHLEYLYADC